MEDKIIYVICVAVIVVFCLMMNRIKKWKEKSALAFFIIGQRAYTGAERKWGYCNALRAGNSIKEHTAELNKYGAKVVGVVCLAKTVRYPSSLNIWWVSHAEK